MQNINKHCVAWADGTWHHTPTTPTPNAFVNNLANVCTGLKLQKRGWKVGSLGFFSSEALGTAVAQDRLLCNNWRLCSPWYGNVMSLFHW